MPYGHGPGNRILFHPDGVFDENTERVERGVAAMNRLVLGILFGALVPWSTARADVTICNDFRAPINVAIAYEDGGTMTSEGWWRVEPKACREVPFDGLDFYYSVESDTYRDGNARS